MISIKRIIIFLFLFAFIVLIVTFTFNLPSIRPLFGDYNNPKLILIYTKYFGSVNWFQSIAKANQLCNCTFSNDLSKLSSADAIVYHWWDVDLIVNKLNDKQKSIWYNLEPPANTRNENYLHKFGHKFDCKATYRSDSDIYLPYGWLIKSTNTQFNSSTSNFIKKPKSVAWLVSKCDSSSKREKYANKLKG